MAAALCLHMPHSSYQNLHSQFSATFPNYTFHRRRHLSFENPASITSTSPRQKSILSIKPTCTRRLSIICMHESSSVDASNNKKVARIKPAVTVVGVSAVILACVVGVALIAYRKTMHAGPAGLCLAWTSMACASILPEPSKSPTVMSADALAKIFHERATAKPTLAEIIRDQVIRDDKLKGYESMLKKSLAISDEGKKATEKLLKEWTEKKNDAEGYDLGLLVNEVLISRGEYAKAKTMCEELVKSQQKPHSDARPHLQLAIIHLMLLVEAMISVDRPKVAKLDEAMEVVKHEWDEFDKKYNLASFRPDQLPPGIKFP